VSVAVAPVGSSRVDVATAVRVGVPIDRACIRTLADTADPLPVTELYVHVTTCPLLLHVPSGEVTELKSVRLVAGSVTVSVTGPEQSQCG
jgi:hypothetical protein